MTSLNSRAKLGQRGAEYSGGSTTIGFRNVDTRGNTMDTEFSSVGPVAVNIPKIPTESGNTASTKSQDDKAPRVVQIGF